MSKVVKSVVRSLPMAAIAFVTGGPWAAAAVVASAVVAGVLTKTAKLSSTDRPRSVTMSSSVAPQLVVYGRTRVATIRAFAASSAYNGTENAYLHQVLVLCTTDDAGVEAIEDVYLNDEVVPLVQDGAGWVPEDGHALAGAVYIEKYLGAAGQAASTVLASAGVSWTSDHRLQGIAYLYVRLYFDPKNGANVWTSGVPQISAVVKGQKVYDPRTGVKAWSNNFALCVRDFLLAPYGYACAATEVDEATMVAAANLSDEQVTLLGGDTQPRYTMDGALYLEGAPGEAVEQMLAAGLASLTYMRGAWRLYPAAYRPPVPGQIVLTADHLRDAPTIEIDPPRDSVANTVTGRYTDPSTWQVSEFPSFQDAAQLAADGEELSQDIDLAFVQDTARAQRLAKIVQRQSRRGTVQWPGTYACLPLRVGETVAVTLPLLGWEAKIFRVERWQLAANGQGVDIDLREDVAADYAWYPTEEAALPVPPDTTLPSATSVQPPAAFALSLASAILTDGTVAPAIAVDISAAPDAMVVDYLVRWREVDSADWLIAAVPSGALRHQIAVRDGATYAVSVASLSVRGVTSAWVTAQTIAVTGGIAGARVAGLELFGQGLDTVFEGPDIRVVWRGVFPDTAAELGSETYGAGTGIANPYFLGYVVRVYSAATGALLRQEPPQQAAEYIYRYDDNKRDGGPHRSVRISVSIAPKVGAEIGEASIILSNPKPGLPAGLDVSALFGGVRFTYTPPSDSDWTGILIFQGLEAGFAPTSTGIVYRGPDTNITIPVTPGETRYFRAALTDAFGEDDLQLTQEYAVTALKIETQDLAEQIVGDDLLTEELKAKIDLVTAGADVPGSVAAQVLAEAQARLVAVAAEADARTAALLAEAQARGTAISEERSARQTETGALSQQITTLSAVANGAVSAIQTEKTARIDGDEAMAQQIDTLVSRVGSAEAAIVEERTTRASADSALTSRTSSLEATVNNTSTGVAAAHSRIAAEETARANADGALASRASSLEATVNNASTGVAAAHSRITTEETARANADSALASRTSSLEATVNNTSTGVAAAHSRIGTEERARADADGVLASRASSLEATVNNTSTGVAAAHSRIAAEETARANADSALASRVDVLTARLGDGSFDAAVTWSLVGTLAGWSVTGGSLWLTSEGWARIGSTSTDPQLRSPSGLTVLGSATTTVRLRLRRVAGTGWDGRLYYTTAGHGESASYSVAVLAPVGSDWQVLEWEMAGLADWKSSTITQLRIDLGSSSADIFDIEWAAIGKRGPAAYQAAIATESSARVSAVAAVAQQITTLQASVQSNTLAIQTEATARADADGTLQGRYGVKIDNNGKVVGFGLMSTANNGQTVGHFAVVADKFSISRPGSTADQYVFVTGTHPVTGQPTLVLSGVTYADVINANQITAGNITASELRLGAASTGQPGIYLRPNDNGSGQQAIFCYDGTRRRASMFANGSSAGFESYDATGRKLFDSNDLGAGVASDRRFVTAAGSAVSRAKGAWVDVHWYDGFVSRGNATRVILTWDTVFTASDGDTNPSSLRWRVVRRPQSFSGADVVIGTERASPLGAAAMAIVSEAAYSSGAADYYAIVFQTFRPADVAADVDSPAKVYRTAYVNSFRMDMEWFR